MRKALPSIFSAFNPLTPPRGKKLTFSTMLVRSLSRVARRPVPSAPRAFSASAAASAPSAKVGFIGLGNMGGHMASNLLAAGKEVCVYDIAADAVARATDAGATSGDTPADVARECGTVITMLPSNPHVQSTYLAPETGLLAARSWHSVH